MLTTVADQRKIDPHKLSHSLRGEVDWIVMKALEKDRNRRYETANSMAADIERYLNDEPVRPARRRQCIDSASSPGGTRRQSSWRRSSARRCCSRWRGWR